MASHDPHFEPSSERVDTLVGQVVADRFNVLSVVARGATGKVYRAEQLPLGRIVALKVLDPLSEHVQGSFELRFLKEAATLARLHHPNTVRVYDYGFFEGRSFLAMEYIEGRPLKELFDEGPMKIRRVTHIVRQIAASLQEAHNAGIVHRDLKPGNVLITDVGGHDDFVKVVDFGLVKDLGDAVEMTGTGMMLGTPTYMAPEQIRGEEVDVRADVYALGVLMYRGITGEPVFRHAQTTGVLMAHLTATPAGFRTTNPDVSVHPLYEWLVMRCLEKHPDDRPADMGEIIRALALCERADEDPHYAQLELELVNGRIQTSMEVLETTLSGYERLPAPLAPPTAASQRNHRVVLGLTGGASFLAGCVVTLATHLLLDGAHAPVATAAPTPAPATVVHGAITSDTTWATDVELDGPVFVESHAILTILPGVTVSGQYGSSLVVTRGGELHAKGEPDAPIVFTGVHTSSGEGTWGGVVLLGGAPVAGGELHAEGLPAADGRTAFGGTDPTWDCGTLSWVRIMHAGAAQALEDELNGLTLDGCGTRTVIENVQVDDAVDDGIAIAGGNVNLRNVLVTGPADDAVDWEQGWTGAIQNLLVVMSEGRGDNAIEADGASLEGVPRLYNLTLLGSGTSAAQRGLLLRQGATAHIADALIGGFGRGAIDVRDPETVANLRAGTLTFGHASLWASGPDGTTWTLPETGAEDDDGGFDERAWLDAQPGIRHADPYTVEAYASNDYLPSADAVAGGVLPPEDDFWRPSTWLGAVPPNVPAPWYRGWTRWPHR